jgi:hypothetical protein
MLGRISSGGFTPRTPYSSRYRDTASSSATAIRPEEVLFRRRNAPVRYEEKDFYFAHESLPPSCPLPSSDLLQTIHTYSSDFYHNATLDGGRDDFRSMDETALIAMGILLEEMAKESLGDTGDLVLVEGEKISDSDNRTGGMSLVQSARKRANTGVSTAYISSGDDLQTVRRRKQKKRKKSASHDTDADREA